LGARRALIHTRSRKNRVGTTMGYAACERFDARLADSRVPMRRPFHASRVLWPCRGISRLLMRSAPGQSAHRIGGIPQRAVDIGLPHRGLMHLAAVRARDPQGSLPCCGEGFHVGLDAGGLYRWVFGQVIQSTGTIRSFAHTCFTNRNFVKSVSLIHVQLSRAADSRCSCDEALVRFTRACRAIAPRQDLAIANHRRGTTRRDGHLHLEDALHRKRGTRGVRFHVRGRRSRMAPTTWSARVK
jgi:hypothetical protein